MTSFPTVIDFEAERAKRGLVPLIPFTAGERLAVMSLPARGAAPDLAREIATLREALSWWFQFWKFVDPKRL